MMSSRAQSHYISFFCSQCFHHSLASHGGLPGATCLSHVANVGVGGVNLIQFTELENIGGKSVFFFNQKENEFILYTQTTDIHTLLIEFLFISVILA